MTEEEWKKTKQEIHDLVNEVIYNAEVVGSCRANFIALHPLNAEELIKPRQKDLLRSQTKLIAYIYNLITNNEREKNDKTNQ